MPLGGAYPGLRTIGGIAEEILAKVRNAGPDAADVRHMPLFGDWYFHDSEYFNSKMCIRDRRSSQRMGRPRMIPPKRKRSH